MSQSPQTGQFNSYIDNLSDDIYFKEVSIPSNGSIQFLQEKLSKIINAELKSQSPQTGQFNSYTSSLPVN